MKDEEDEDILLNVDQVDQDVLDIMVEEVAAEIVNYTPEDWESLCRNLEMENLDIDGSGEEGSEGGINGQNNEQERPESGSNNNALDLWESESFRQEAVGGDEGEQVTDDHRQAVEVYCAEEDRPGFDREGGGRNCSRENEEEGAAGTNNNDDEEEKDPPPSPTVNHSEGEPSSSRQVDTSTTSTQTEVANLVAAESLAVNQGEHPAMFAVEYQRSVEEDQSQNLPDAEGDRVVTAAEGEAESVVGEEEAEERVSEVVGKMMSTYVDNMFKTKEEEERIKKEEEEARLAKGKRRSRAPQNQMPKKLKMYEAEPPPESAPKEVKRAHSQRVNAKRNRDKQKDEKQRMREAIEQLQMEKEASTMIIKKLSRIIAKKGLIGELEEQTNDDPDDEMDVEDEVDNNASPIRVSMSLHYQQSVPAHNPTPSTSAIAVSGIRN